MCTPIDRSDIAITTDQALGKWYMRHFEAETWYLFDFSFPPPCCRPSCPAKCARNVGGSAACPQTTTFREFKFHKNFLQTNLSERHHKDLWSSWPLYRMTASIWEIVFPVFLPYRTSENSRELTATVRGGQPLGSAWPQYRIFYCCWQLPLKVISPRKVCIIATYKKLLYGRASIQQLKCLPLGSVTWCLDAARSPMTLSLVLEQTLPG